MTEDYNFSMEKMKMLENEFPEGGTALEKSIYRLGITGIMDEDARECFREKMRDKGVSIELIARRFGVTTSSVHKWLSGQTKRLPVSSRLKMKAFLTADEETMPLLDSGVELVAEPSVYYGFPDAVAELIPKIMNVHDMCTKYSIGSVIFKQKMQKAINSVIRELLPELVQRAMEKRKNWATEKRTVPSTNRQKIF